MFYKLLNKLSKYWLKISFFALGLGSLIWFLIRVIPKPSRAQYPCMKAAFPVASSFISYIAGISIFAFLLRRAKAQFMKSKYILATGMVVLGLIAGSWAVFNNSGKVDAASIVLATPQTPNTPMGEGKGIFPGRVTWVHNPDATNENCPNSNNNYWSNSNNTNQAVVDSMVSTSIKWLTGATTDKEAWDLIFRYYNKSHNRGDVGYTEGEKIVIKINVNGQAGSGGGGWNSPITSERNINTSPQVCTAILNNLINTVGVRQYDISIGDPSNTFRDKSYNAMMTKFPSVNYWKSKPTASSKKVFNYSDGSKLTEYVPQAYVDATYMINIPVFKKHHRAGISITTKNHVGSMSPYNQQSFEDKHWHQSLPCPDATGSAVNGKYGEYRCFVDYMGHKDLGNKTILYLVDGLWGSTNWGHPAIKWRMAPFNNDYPNSLFASIDPVALESVCFDFLYQEFDEKHPTEGITAMSSDYGPFARFAGTDDFLHQAADKANWPADVKYDPEADGTELPSLGTHEHWNNATDKQYTRNLSKDGKGIQLYSPKLVSTRLLRDELVKGNVVNYPNPFKESTTLKFNLVEESDVMLDIYSIDGKKQHSASLGRLRAGQQQYKIDINNLDKQLQPGTCIYTLNIRSNKGETSCSGRMSVVR